MVCCFAFQISASVIYSNITTDEISPAGSFYGVEGGGFEEAFNFVIPAGESYTLDELDVSLLALNDLDPSLQTMADVYLYADSAGFPGTLIESFAVQVPGVYPPMTNSITEVLSQQHPILTGGTPIGSP
jgi:hypothetical protein